MTRSPRLGLISDLYRAEVTLGLGHRVRVQAFVGLDARGGSPSRDDLVRVGVDDELGGIGQRRYELCREIRRAQSLQPRAPMRGTM